ncbi:MAG: translation initiation factor IF-2 subunit alpha [Candidatus Hydrothermarchaeales archaeon]
MSSLVKKKDPYPREGDLVMCTITKVFSHGAFARLDEYGGKEGFIHISEVASTWIKNIRDFIKEGQKTVAKVLSVDPVKGHVDLSVRRVGEAQKKNKSQLWKRDQKAEKLLELVAKRIGKTLDEAYDEMGFKLEDEYGEIYAGLEEISILKEEALRSIGIKEVWIKPLLEVVEENVEFPLVDITGYLELRCPAPDGVDRIKEALINARDKNSVENIGLEIQYVGSPRYRIHVTAPDYKVAEEAMKKVADDAISYIKSREGTGTFLREIKV